MCQTPHSNIVAIVGSAQIGLARLMGTRGEELLRSLHPGPDRTTATEKRVRIGGPAGFAPDKDECRMQLEANRKSPNDNDRILE